MEIILFTVVGIAMYLLSDQILLLLERLHGEPLPQRSLVFFVVILVLTMSTFSILRTWLAPEEGTQDHYQEHQTTD